MRLARCDVESFLGKKWEIDAEFKPPVTPLHPPCAYEFIVYLAITASHRPFWTGHALPYIAAYFAFRTKRVPRSERVAVYSYVGDLGYGYLGSKRWLNDIGPTMTTDRRHHIQQCEYTYAVDCSGEARTYCDHESAFAQPKVTPQQMLKKYILPYSERLKVLAKLDFMNINSYSLFGDEESLMEMIAYRLMEQESL